LTECVELEHSAVARHCYWIIEIHTIHQSDELDSERDAAGLGGRISRKNAWRWEPSATAAPPALRAHALTTLGSLAYWQGDYTQAYRFLEAAVVSAREANVTIDDFLGDSLGRARSAPPRLDWRRSPRVSRRGPSRHGPAGRNWSVQIRSAPFAQGDVGERQPEEERLHQILVSTWRCSTAGRFVGVSLTVCRLSVTPSARLSALMRNCLLTCVRATRVPARPHGP
jgi:hypothetical protein